jgi:acyl-CoA thioester hydrolase|tara:strand:+ start:121 stop:537 length:417 start_codon:yes stop_codon:yes gene_type:complete
MIFKQAMKNIHNFNLSVYYEDTDAGGIVYYANYLKFIERARSEMIYELFNLNHQKLKKDHDAIFVVRSCNVKYSKSAKFEDKLNVQTTIIKKSAVRLNLLQEVKRKKELLVSADVELAVVNSKGEVNKLSSTFLEKLK